MNAEQYAAICKSKKLRIAIAKKSLPFFRRYYLGRATPAHMLEWADDVQELWEHRNDPITDYPHYLWRLAPKDHAKTTFHVQDVALWLICTQDPDIRIVIATITPELGMDSLGAIARQFAENKKLIEDFGPFIPPLQRAAKTKWTARQLTVLTRRVFDDKNPTIRIFGARDSIQGTRASVILCDDIIDLKGTDDARQRKKMSRWFWSELLGLMSPSTIVIGIGTKKHSLDLHNELEKKSGTSGWIFKLQKAIIDLEQGIVLWPEQRNLSWLLAKRGMNATEFARDYQNEIVADADRKFKAWGYWSGRPDDLPRPLHVWTFCDAAYSVKEGADRTGFVTVGISPDGDWRILESFARRMNPSEILDEWFKQLEKWGKFADRYAQGWEPYLVEGVLSHFLKLEQRRRKVRLPISVIYRSSEHRGKGGHINALEPLFHSDDRKPGERPPRILIGPGQNQLEGEIGEWTGEDTGGYCDILDALADGVGVVKPPSTLEVKPGPGTYGSLLNRYREKAGLSPRRFEALGTPAEVVSAPRDDA